MAAPQPDIDRPGVCGHGTGLASARVLGCAVADPPFPPPSAATQEIFDRLFADDVQQTNTARLCVSPRASSIRSSWVFFHPTILIPPVFDEPGGDPELLRLSLLHEIAHADRWDPWFGTIASLAQTVWFFLPQIWWLRSQLLIDQEFLADRSAALRYGTSSGYAASLLVAGEASTGHRRWTCDRAEVVTSRAVGRQIARSTPRSLSACSCSLYCPFRFEARAPRSWSWTLRITLVVATLIAACLCIRWPDASALEHRLKHGTPALAPVPCHGLHRRAPRFLERGPRCLSTSCPLHSRRNSS